MNSFIGCGRCVGIICVKFNLLLDVSIYSSWRPIVFHGDRTKKYRCSRIRKNVASQRITWWYVFQERLKNRLRQTDTLPLSSGCHYVDQYYSFTKVLFYWIFRKCVLLFHDLLWITNCLDIQCDLLTWQWTTTVPMCSHDSSSTCYSRSHKCEILVWKKTATILVYLHFLKMKD